MVLESPRQNQGSSLTYFLEFKKQRSLHGRQVFKKGAISGVNLFKN
jgi:hypothetical protein